MLLFLCLQIIYFSTSYYILVKQYAITKVLQHFFAKIYNKVNFSKQTPSIFTPTKHIISKKTIIDIDTNSKNITF